MITVKTGGYFNSEKAMIPILFEHFADSVCTFCEFESECKDPSQVPTFCPFRHLVRDLLLVSDGFYHGANSSEK